MPPRPALWVTSRTGAPATASGRHPDAIPAHQSMITTCPALLRCATDAGYIRGMTDLSRHRGARISALLAITCIGLAAAGCGSSNSGASGTPKKTGTVNVAYASSLEFLNEKDFAPAFEKASGYKYSGTAGASGDLESDIAAGEIHPNVFESVGGDNITPLFPKFTKWYAQYAGTSMVVAYNPNGKYASKFKAI